MASLNKTMLMGNLGHDIELRYTANGTAVANISIATNSKYTNALGEAKSDVQWHRIVVWGKQAENCKDFLKKGDAIYVEGRLQTRQYEDKNKVTHYITEVVTQFVQFINTKNKSQNSSIETEKESIGMDDLPF